MADSSTHLTPADCALDGWADTPAAQPRVVSVEVRGAKAQVLIVVGHEEDWVDCWEDGNGLHSGIWVDDPD